MPMYREIAATTVPANTKQAVEAALKHGCATLGFALAPEIRWCTQVTNQAELERIIASTPRGKWSPPGYKFALQPFLGLNDSKHWCLWLVPGQSTRETAITTLHELAHLHYRVTGRPHGDWGTKLRADEETDCEAWAQAWYRRLPQ